MKAKVHITLKKSISDPQGIAVKNALNSLKYNEVKDVRIGKIIELDLGECEGLDIENRIREMCEKLLANTVVEHYRYEVLEG